MRFPPEPTRELIRAKYWQTFYQFITLKRKPIPNLRPFIVAGPPRSGTSLICTLLNAKPNIIISNEPKQITGKRFELADPTTLLKGFIIQTARTAIRKRKIYNKVDPRNPDKLTADTFNTGAARRYVPININPDQPLAVGAKAPMPLLDNLEDFCNNWPELKAVLIVRDPLRTINSWRHTFGWQHGLDDPSKGAKLKIYDRVPLSPNPLERRAHLWKITVDQCAHHAQKRPSRVLLIQYEDLIDNPAQVVTNTAKHLGSPAPETPIDTSSVRPQSSPNYKNLNESDIQLITRICQVPPANTPV